MKSLAAVLGQGLASSLGLDLGGVEASLPDQQRSCLSLVQWWRNPIEPCLVEGKTISLAEMYIQDQEWRDKWNDKPKLKDIQFYRILSATLCP
jgi:hypothetical protein